MKKKSQSTAPKTFLEKIFDMLSNESLCSIVSWISDGTEFLIQSLPEFTEKVLPIYFKHSNFASFIRQLNMYDFHKIRSNPEENIYKHPLFLKGRLDLLKEIHRKTSDNNWPAIQKQSLSKGDMNPVINKLMQMHKKNIGYEAQISGLEEKVERLTSQNKVLAGQLWGNKDLLNKIENAMVFFVRLFKNTGNEEGFGGMSHMDNFLSITGEPQEMKRQKVEDVSGESPLNLFAFDEFHEVSGAVDEKVEGLENHSEISFDDKIDFLFE